MHFLDYLLGGSREVVINRVFLNTFIGKQGKPKHLSCNTLFQSPFLAKRKTPDKSFHRRSAFDPPKKTTAESIYYRPAFDQKHTPDEFIYHY